MNNSTRARKIGFEALKADARRKVSINLSEHSLNKSQVEKLRVFYGVRTTTAVIERAISNTAARLALSDCDILENAVLDKLALVKQLQPADSNEKPPPKSEVVKIKAMNWEIIIISSQAPISFNSSEALVNFCLKYSSEQMKALFGDA